MSIAPGTTVSSCVDDCLPAAAAVFDTIDDAPPSTTIALAARVLSGRRQLPACTSTAGAEAGASRGRSRGRERQQDGKRIKEGLQGPGRVIVVSFLLG